MRFIWTKESAETNAYARFEMCFTAEEAGKITASVCVSGEYTLYINDAVAGFGQFADWPGVGTIQRHDITALCKAGENRLSLLVWHPGINTMVTVNKAPYAAFEIEQAGNTLCESGTDTLSRVENAYTNGEVPLITTQLGYTFLYDATAEPKPFEASAHADAPKELRERPTALLEMLPLKAGKLCARGWYREGNRSLAPAERMYASLLSIREDADADGIYAVYDMGEESVGFIDIDIECAEPCEILIGWGEHLADMRVRTSVGGRGFAAIYRAKAGENRFAHTLRRWGCRYIQIHVPDKNAKLNHIGLRRVQYPLETIEPLDTGDQLHNAIYRTGLHTLRCCMHDHYEDCPWREQALYAMDSRVQMLCGYYAFHETRMPRASLQLLAEGQRESGLLEICAPSRWPFTIPGFSMAWVVALWEYVEHSGDTESIGDLADRAVIMLNKVSERMDERGCLHRYDSDAFWNFYEWQPGLSGNIGGTETDIADGLLTAWFALALDACMRILKAMGRDHRQFEALHAKALKGLKVFRDPESGLYDAFEGKHLYAELMQSLVVLSGACDADENAFLREALAKREGMIQVTLNDAILRYDALMQDQPRYRKFVFDEIAVIWGSMLHENATTFWETEIGQADFSNAGSLCHGWSAVPVYMYHAYGFKVE